MEKGITLCFILKVNKIALPESVSDEENNREAKRELKVYNSVSQTMGRDQKVGRQGYADGSRSLVNYRT